MQKKKVPVLSVEIKKILTSFSRSRSLPSSLVKRSKIILLAAQGITNQSIAHEVSLHFNNVATWRNRFLNASPSLSDIEANKPEDLEKAVRAILTDEQRPGAPAVFTSEQIVKIVDLACKDPSDFGYEVSHWSLPLLVKEIKKQGIADQISAKSVSRFLKQGEFKAP